MDNIGKLPVYRYKGDDIDAHRTKVFRSVEASIMLAASAGFLILPEDKEAAIAEIEASGAPNLRQQFHGRNPGVLKGLLT